MTALNKNCILNWDADYYLEHIILDDMKEHSIEPTEEKLQLSRNMINKFLQDCLRVGRYFLYNFYGTNGDYGTVGYGIYHRWSYDFYLQKHYLGLSSESTDPGICQINKNNESIFKDTERYAYAYVLQKPPYLPHEEVINACGLVPSMDRPGLKLWHSGMINYRMAVKYEMGDDPVEIPEELYDHILRYNVPFLADYVKCVTIRKTLGLGVLNVGH